MNETALGCIGPNRHGITRSTQLTTTGGELGEGRGNFSTWRPGGTTACTGSFLTVPGEMDESALSRWIIVTWVKVTQLLSKHFTASICSRSRSRSGSEVRCSPETLSLLCKDDDDRRISSPPTTIDIFQVRLPACPSNEPADLLSILFHLPVYSSTVLTQQ